MKRARTAKDTELQGASADAPVPEPPALAPTGAGDPDLQDFFRYIEEVYHGEPSELDADPGEALEPADGVPAGAAPPPPSPEAPPLRPFTLHSRTIVLLDQGMSPATWWRLVLIEIAILFGLAAGLELLLGGGTVGALGWQPNPYWILVLVMAAARGAVAGLLAGATASALLVIGHWQQSLADGLRELLTLEIFTEPLLFLGVGFLIGEFRDELAQRHRKLLRKHQMLMGAADHLRQENAVLTAANRELKRRFVDDTTQFGSLVDAAVMIESTSHADIYDLALFMVVEHCGASTCSVLVVMENGEVDLAREVGWEQDDTRQRLDEADRSPQVRQAVEQGVRVNGLSPTEPPPTSGPLVVAPIPDQSGVVRALLCLDEIPASRFNDSTVSTFFGIAEWITASLKRISRGEKPFDFRSALAEMSTPAPWLGTPADLGARILIEDERCSRMGVVTSLLTLQTTDPRVARPAALSRLDLYFQDNFSTGLRLSDGLYRFGYPGCYVLVLAGTNREGADVVRLRLQRRLGFLDIPEIGKIEITTFSPDDEAPDLQRLLPRIVDTFRAASPIPLEPRCPVPRQSTTVLGTLEDFVRRVRVEVAMAQRYDLDLHILDFKTSEEDLESGQMVARHIEHIAENWLRGTDGIYVVGPNRCAVVLPGSSPKYAGRILERLSESLRQRIPESRVDSFQPSVLGLGASESASLLHTFFGEKPGQTS